MSILIISRGKCGLTGCITYYLLSMAVADLLVVLTNVIVNRILGVYFPASFLSVTPVCAVKTVALYVAKDCSVWLTVAFTFDRYVAICCPNFRNKYCTRRRAALVIGLVCAGCLFRNIPWYFAFEHLVLIDNVPWYCMFVSNYFTSRSWIAFSFSNLVVSLFLPLGLTLLFNALTIRYILLSSRIRRRLRGQKSSGHESDSEIQNRKQSVVLLLAISANLIILWLTFVAHYIFARSIGKYFYTTSDPLFYFSETGYLLLLLSCSTNTLIYAAVQSKFREEIKYLVLYHFRRAAELIKSQR
ncbi:tachykinin-like peptides receptor 86C [Amblyraja radiata]|uniref:tachykinin-like peptides receptor 86C n=1 Tax=Amblyraja radiata TaxID=386614 RepID=UPI00140292A8|nr:tachykinin-like peptides receptor 86C [Amblyraja radiata]